MRVSLYWQDGSITKMQGVNALKIAQHWLYKYVDLLLVFCNTNNTVYLKEE